MPAVRISKASFPLDHVGEFERLRREAEGNLRERMTTGCCGSSRTRS